MTHTVLITAHPQSLLVSRMALSYCESVVAEGGRINQIFFMHDANYMAIHPSAQQWSVFAAEHNVSLQTCISTAEQKSIQLRDYAAGFQQGGLSALADSLLCSEYLAQFNAGCDNAVPLKKTALIDKKKILFVFNSVPEDGALAAEGIDLLLVLSAFEADISVVFEGDGIQNIVEPQSGSSPRYIKRFLALDDFGVDQLYVFDGGSQSTKIQCDVLTESKFERLLHESHVMYF